MSNKSNRKFIFGKRGPNIGSNNNTNQGSKLEISVQENAGPRVKRLHGDKNGNSEDQPSTKRPKLKYELPHNLQPCTSSKNIANKRLEDLRKSLQEKRVTVESEINKRLNKTVNSDSANTVSNDSWNTWITENKFTKEVSLQGTSGFCSIQSRLSVQKSSTDLKNNNSTVTTSNINSEQEKEAIDDAQFINEIKQSSSPFRFFPANNSSITSANLDDSMEWESVDEATVLNNVFWFGSAMFQWSFMARQLVTDINKIRKDITYNKKLSIDDVLNNSDPLAATQNGVFIVVDTNIFLSQMNILVQLRKKELKDLGRVTIILPWMVLQELDYMKDLKCHLNKNARKAVTYINSQLVLNDPYFKGQTVLEASKQETCSNNADDGILHCCMQLVAEKKFVILLSNDINLRNKVLVNKIQSYDSNTIMDGLNKLNIPQLNEKNKVDKIKIILSNLLTRIIEDEMRNAYGDIWLKMVNGNPPYTMEEALAIMSKYWISCFSCSLQKQAHRRIDEFLLFSKCHKNDVQYSQDTYNKFMEYSLTLCIYLKNGYPCHKTIIMESLSNIQKCGE